jgi:hypothetical protein
VRPQVLNLAYRKSFLTRSKAVQLWKKLHSIKQPYNYELSQKIHQPVAFRCWGNLFLPGFLCPRSILKFCFFLVITTVPSRISSFLFLMRVQKFPLCRLSIFYAREKFSPLFPFFPDWRNVKKNTFKAKLLNKERWMVKWFHNYIHLNYLIDIERELYIIS